MTYYVLFISILSIFSLIILYAFWKGIKILGIGTSIFAMLYIITLSWSPLALASTTNSTLTSQINYSYVNFTTNQTTIALIDNQVQSQNEVTDVQYVPISALDNYTILIFLFVIYAGILYYFELDFEIQEDED